MNINKNVYMNVFNIDKKYEYKHKKIHGVEIVIDVYSRMSGGIKLNC